MQNGLQQAHVAERGIILTKAVLRAAERLGIPGSKVAEILGVSEAQVSRFKRGEAFINDRSKTFELAALFVRAFRSIDAITGGNETVARTWMTSPNSALGARPADRITSAQGLVDVVAYLDARRAPI